MKTVLSREHRKILKTTVAQARAHAEAGAEKTFKALAVATKDAPPTPPMPRRRSAPPPE